MISRVLGIERAKRLVEQQNSRITGKRTGNCHSLFHAAGELSWKAIFETGKTDHTDQPIDNLLTLDRRHPLALQPVPDVVAHGEPRKQSIFLKDNAAIGARTGDRRAVNDDLAVRFEKATNDI